MPENKSQLARLLFIDEQIRQGMNSGRLPNCSSLAQAYEVSSKTIQRDLDFLRQRWEAPLAYDPQRRGYHYTQENYGLPALHVNEGEMVGLLLARQGLEAYRNTPVHDSLMAVFQKLADVLPDKVSVDAAWLGERITVLPEQHAIIDPDSWNLVCRALQLSRSLYFDYRKPRDPTAGRRQADPYHLTHYQGAWYLLAYCHSRRRILTFALSRISKVELQDRTFLVPEDFKLADSRRNSFGIFQGQKVYQVDLRFNSSAAPYVVERIWQPDQGITSHKDGSLTLSLPTTDLIEIKRWVLSWGEEVKVLAPEKLQEEVKRSMAAALDSYR